MRPLGVAAMLLKGSAKCVYLCVRCGRAYMCVFQELVEWSSVLLTGWGSPTLIPLHFIGLDSPSYNCIKALSPPSPTVSPSSCIAVTTCPSPAHVENTSRDEQNLCWGQRPFSPSLLLSPSFLLCFFVVKVVEVIVMLRTAVDCWRCGRRKVRVGRRSWKA